MTDGKNTARSTFNVYVIGKPEKPEALTASAGDGAVTLNWVTSFRTPSHMANSVTKWQYRVSDDGAFDDCGHSGGLIPGPELLPGF